MNQTWENGKKPSFEPDFGPYGPNSGCQFFFFFFQNSGSANSWSAIIMYNIRKNNDPILRKLSDGPRDRQADGQTDRWTRVISKDAVRLKWAPKKLKNCTNGRFFFHDNFQYFSRFLKIFTTFSIIFYKWPVFQVFQIFHDLYEPW